MVTQSVGVYKWKKKKSKKLRLLLLQNFFRDPIMKMHHKVVAEVVEPGGQSVVVEQVGLGATERRNAGSKNMILCIITT